MVTSVLLGGVLLLSGCDQRKPARPSATPVAAVRAPSDAAVTSALFDATDLQPGTLRAFGVVMPVETVEQLATDSSRVYSVQAPMARVMRYLEQRLRIANAQIHPLGAMVRGAQVPATVAGGGTFTLDLAVRAEGDRTMVTLWNRTTVPTPPRSIEDGLRAAGIDPRTGQPLPQNNY